MSKEYFICSPDDPNDPVMKRIAQVNKALEKAAEERVTEYEDSDNLVPLAMAVLKRHGNLKLWGPTGTGKSLLASHLARELGAKFFNIQMTLDTQTYNLISEPRIFDGQTKIALNVVTQWLLHEGPAVLAAEEPNLSHSGILGIFYDLTDDRRQTYIPDLGTVLKRGDDKYLIITYNPAEKSEYAGTQMLNIAFSRRFEGFAVGYLPQTKEMKIVKGMGLSHRDADKLCQMAQFTRTAYIQGELITPITLGNLKAWAKLIIEDDIEMTNILKLIIGMYPESQHGVIMKFWGNNE